MLDEMIKRRHPPHPAPAKPRISRIAKPVQITLADGRKVWNAPATDRLLWTMQRIGGPVNMAMLREAVIADWPAPGEWSARDITSKVQALTRRGAIARVAPGYWEPLWEEPEGHRIPASDLSIDARQPFSGEVKSLLGEIRSLMGEIKSLLGEIKSPPAQTDVQERRVRQRPCALLDKPRLLTLPGGRQEWTAPSIDRALWTMQQIGGEYDAQHLANRVLIDWPDEEWAQPQHQDDPAPRQRATMLLNRLCAQGAAQRIGRGKYRPTITTRT